MQQQLARLLDAFDVMERAETDLDGVGEAELGLNGNLPDTNVTMLSNSVNVTKVPAWPWTLETVFIEDHVRRRAARPCTPA